MLKNYDIDISKLNLGQHEFQFKIDDTFFELFEYSLVEKGDLEVQVLLEMKTTFIQLNIQISGKVELVCDRSLDKFEYDLNAENTLLFKYGDESAVIDEEVEIITFNTQKINIANQLYEFVSVAIPMKKLHPRFDKEPNEDQVIYSSGEKNEEKDIDPRWSELKKLKNKSK